MQKVPVIVWLQDQISPARKIMNQNGFLSMHPLRRLSTCGAFKLYNTDGVTDLESPSALVFQLLTLLFCGSLFINFYLLTLFIINV